MFGKLKRADLVRWLVGWLLAAAWAGAFAAPPRTLRFERLSIQDGLSQESVLTILQDRQGFMWFGTQTGLNRYDGYQVTVFRNEPSDPDSLVDNFVTASFEDARGRLWFGTRGGLARFDPASGKFMRYVPGDAGPRGAANRTVNAIVADGRGGLWLGTGDGLKHFDPASGRFTALRHDARDPGSLRDDSVTALALDNHGALWAGTAAGLERLAPGARAFEHFAIEPAADARRNTVLALSMGPRETLWIGTAAGLEAWRLGEGAPQRRHLGPADGIPADARIHALYHDRGPNLWVGTGANGLLWLDPASGKLAGYRNEPFDPHSLPDNQVTSVWVDRTGTLWVGTQFGGASRTDLASGGFARFVYLPGQARGLGNGKVRAIAGNGDGRLWLGTMGGGLSLFDPATGTGQQWRHDPAHRDGLPDDMVSALALARGRLWVGTTSGLSWRDPASGRFTQVPLGREAASGYVMALTEDRAGTLWIATRGGLFALDPDGHTLHTFRHDPDDPGSLSDNFAIAVFEDSRGRLWVGTDNGLDCLDRASGKFTHLRHDPADPRSLRHNRVHHLFESSRGELWVATAGGVQRLEEGAGSGPSFRFFRVTAASDAVPIGALLEDGRGALWISTSMGISRLDPASRRFKTYGPRDGLIDGSYFVGSALRGPDGQMYFGGVGGLTAFAPDAVRDNPYPPAVAITGLSVFNRPRTLPGSERAPGQVALSYRDSAFALEFAALHYADPQANRYLYRLEGFDDGWVEAGAGRRFATYTNLDPGSYVFQVRASNKDGVWSEAPATLAITIAPPFWKTWWFRTLAALAVLAAAYGGYRLRVRVLVRQQRLLESEVGARTAELLLQKEAAERQNDVVEQARRNIALLSDVGRKLTANLDSEAIMATLYEHVQELMDASVFAVAAFRPERDAIAYPFAVVGGRRCAPWEHGARETQRMAAWCIGRGREVIIDDFGAECGDYLGAVDPALAARLALPCPDAAGSPRSLLFVPIVAGARVLGAVTVQSFAPCAYQRIHLDMLRTLAAYVGVAFDNADAYRQLKETQAQLAAQERLASLGSLVAGVAHELNTPIGNSLLMASTLHDKTAQLAEQFDQASLRKSELAAWIAASREASSLIMRSLHGAAELVSSFKQVSVDQASAQRRRFDLAQACHEIGATMMNKVRRAGHTLELAVPDGITLDSYPGPFGRVLINFVDNALLHAFEAPGGHMRLAASQPDAGRVRIEFSDDGRGIAPEHVARIFDPFFTTRMGQGGSGLGLNIAYNIVDSLLDGTIRVESTPGKGTVFIIDLPLKPSGATPPPPDQNKEKA